MKHKQDLICAVFVVIATAMSSTALAQKTYRCGNTYQSFPCAGNDGKAVKAIDGGATTKPAGADSAAKPAGASASTGKTAEATKSQMTEEEKKAAALAEKKSKCDKLKNDLNYNTAQLRAGGSNVTQDRLNAERRQINDNLGREGCST